MPLDDAGMHRTGLAFSDRIVHVLIVGLSPHSLCAFHLLLSNGFNKINRQRGFENRSGVVLVFILHAVFLLSSALWALEIAQRFGLVNVLHRPNELSTDDKFARFYALVPRKTSITGVMFECQVRLAIPFKVQCSYGDVSVIPRLLATWHERRIVFLLPLLSWSGSIVNMIVHASLCRSGVNNINYIAFCRGTDVAAPVLSIVANVSVMSLTIWKAWFVTSVVRSLRSRKKNKIFSVSVLLIESGTLYVIMLTIDLLVTSLVTGGPESAGRMIDCISGYSAVRFVVRSHCLTVLALIQAYFVQGMYPTLIIVVSKATTRHETNDVLYI
ncbi:hypothetical protein B0H13DRAFT_1599250 [Mycena leptocephala]|nr:hypothetical protein B0H13DRAFT_1599250 [Mycena leptocephala]